MIFICVPINHMCVIPFISQCISISTIDVFYLNNAYSVRVPCALLDSESLIHAHFISLLFVIRVWHPPFPLNGTKK